MPENTTIAGALKLSGKTSKGLSFGIIESLTTREYADIYDAGEEFRQEVEPLSNYFIGRFQQEYDRGNTLIGGILTHTHRSINDDNLNFLSNNAMTFGADFTRYWKDRKYFLETKLIGSHINGDDKAIQRLQMSSARYFQRPDNTNVEYDPSLTSLSGVGASVKAGKWSKGHWRYNEEINYRSPGLELNDLGYMMYSNLLKNNSSVSYIEKENKGILKNFEINAEQQNAWNGNGDGLYSQALLSAQIEFMNSWMTIVRGQYKWRINDERILRGGPSMKLPDQFSTNFILSTNRAKNISLSLVGNWATHLTGESNNLMINTGLNVRALSNLRFTLQPLFQRTKDELQYIQQIRKQDGSTS